MNLSSRGSRRSLIRNLLAGLCLGAMVGSLAACGGAVGGGNAPRRMVIAPAGGTVALPTLRMYQCLTSGLRALLYFDDGSVGDFTNRVVWSSSNAGVAKVSNGDIPGPSGGFYTPGALIPDGTGNAIITADYFGITGQTAVSVGSINSIELKAVINGNYMPLWRINTNHTAPTNSFTMGQGTSVQVAVTAVLDNVETDVTNFATLGFKDTNTPVATMVQQNGAANLVAGALGGPVVPVASFSPCSITTITDPTKIVNMSVSPVQSIAMQPEFPPPDPTQPVSGSNPLPDLFVGNSERFKVIGSLASGDSQDVSAQSTLTVQNGSSAAQFGGGSGINNLLFASAPGQAVLKATFNQNGAALTAPFISTIVATGVMQTFTVCWTDIFTTVQSCPANQSPATVQAGTLTPLQFHAIGNYGLDANNQPIMQDVTRSTTWTSGATSVATIGSGGNIAGQALGVSQGSVTITVANSSAVNIPSVTTGLTVSPPP